MKKSKWIWIGVVIVLIAAGIYAYLNFGASADVVMNKACAGKIDERQIIIPVGDTAYMAKKAGALKKPEKADPDGIFVQGVEKGNALIYFTDGMKYQTKPTEESGKVVLDAGGYFYKADASSAVTPPPLPSGGIPGIYIYKDAVYYLSNSLPISNNVVQYNGISMICGLKTSHEIDIARKSYLLRSTTAVDAWKAQTTRVTEDFMNNFFASMPPTGDAARAKVAIESLSAAAKKIVLENSTNGNYSAGLAKFIGINGDAPDKGMTITGASRSSDGSVSVSVSLAYSGQSAPTRKVLVLKQENNTWKIDHVADVHIQ